MDERANVIPSKLEHRLNRKCTFERDPLAYQALDINRNYFVPKNERSTRRRDPLGQIWPLWNTLKHIEVRVNGLRNEGLTKPNTLHKPLAQSTPRFNDGP